MIAIFKSYSMFSVQCKANDWLRKTKSIIITGMEMRNDENVYTFSIYYFEDAPLLNKLPQLLQSILYDGRN